MRGSGVKFGLVRPAAKKVLVVSVAIIATSLVALAGSRGQTGIPAITGVYSGSGTSMNCGVSGSLPFTLSITAQAGDAWSANLTSSVGDGNTVFFDGTVDANGNLQGTYNWSGPDSTEGMGTFTGAYTPGDPAQGTPAQIDIEASGTVTTPIASCEESIDFSLTEELAGGPSADLSITGSASSAKTAPGTTLTYTLTIKNAGPSDATSAIVVNPAPVGASIVSATTSQGECVTTPGNAESSLGTLASGASATVTVVVSIQAAAGTVLTDSPNVTSPVFDPNLGNNTATITTPVEGGASVELGFRQPSPSSGDSTPAPSGLQAQPGSPPASSAAKKSAPAVVKVVKQDASASDSCSLSGVNVYASSDPSVQPEPSNLFTTLPSTALTTTVPVSPAGESFVVTNLWDCGGTTTESQPSNEVNLPAGPTISAVTVKGSKLKITGAGFSGKVEVYVNGVAFVKKASVVDGTEITQKGDLTDGSAIPEIGQSGAVLITVKNENGGYASFAFTQQ